MKKFIALLCLLFFTVTLYSQKNNYVDLTKKDTVTVNIITATEKQAKKQDVFQTELLKAVDSYVTTNAGVTNSLKDLSSNFPTLIKQIEQRNKNDSEFVLNKLGFVEDHVKHVIKTERWLNFITAFLTLVYIIWSMVPTSLYTTEKFTSQGILAKLAFTLFFSAVIYFLLLRILTLLFNGDFYVIKELITLYT